MKKRSEGEKEEEEDKERGEEKEESGKPMDMEFELKAQLKCSGSLSGISPREIAEFVSFCNREILKKGAPPGSGAEIVWWNVGAENVEL